METYGYRWRPKLPVIVQLDVEIDPGYINDDGEEEPVTEGQAEDMDDSKTFSSEIQAEGEKEEKTF